MDTVAEKTVFTPEDLLHMPDCKSYELVNGQLVEREMSLEACEVTANIIRILSEYVRRMDLGGVYASEVGYRCFPDAPDKVRKPDASFIRKDRLLPEYAEGHVPIAPDLAIESVSPNDAYYEVLKKVDEYLRAGVRLVWVLTPSGQTVQIFRPDGSDERLDAGGQLDGEHVVPGFRCPVSALFETALRRHG